MHHFNFNADICVPDHKPQHGQKIWVDMTRERAEFFAKMASKKLDIVPDGFVESLTKSFYHDGEAPDLKIHMDF